jgi:hypothetical protein
MGKLVRINALGHGFSAVILVPLVVLPVCGCEKPECTGPVTADLGAGQNGCDEAWIHGEQMCPQKNLCGQAVICMAFSDWSYGSCTCQKADDETCCPIAIVDPEDGAIRSMADDVDLETPGLQIQVTVDIDCWYFGWANLFVHACDQPTGEEIQWLEPHPDFHVPALVDMGTRNGCFQVCAETMFGGIVLASDSIQVCVE